jgi:regulator of sirC expression with transglutaminase-like and TPR domain
MLGKLEDALKAYNKLIILVPQQPHAWHQRATVLAGLGKLEQALNDYERFLKLAPNAAQSENARKSIAELRAKLSKEKGS